MDTAIVLTEEETAHVLTGDEAVIQAIRIIAKDKNIITVLGKDDDGILYDVTGNALCAHKDTYLNDRSQTVCRECGEELGR